MIDKNIYLPGWFESPGAWVLVDGQFGSTGKGLMAGWLAEYGKDRVTHITTNAGPNSGHTAYWDHGCTGAKERPELAYRIMTQQIPVASVFMKEQGRHPITLLNAGAVIDTNILDAECKKYGFNSTNLLIHPNAAVITEADRTLDQITVGSIASTGKGTGPALAQKVLRHGGKTAHEVYRPMLPAGFRPDRGWDNFWDWGSDVVFVETAQGFSLGVNTARFYPQTTSRECTVMQAVSDARIPAQMVKGVIGCFRTYPIRVGNTDNSSGGCYEDQMETSWGAVGVAPELTTVTKRVRRVFTWSRIQFREAVAANRPDVILLNFANYMSPERLDALVDNILEDYGDTLGRGRAPTILGGFSPYGHDIRRLV